MKKKKDRLPWSDYERALVVQHQKSFGRGANKVLFSKLSYRSKGSVWCELTRFDDWKRTGIMEFGCNPKHKGGRKGVIATYIRIIKDLGL